MYAIILEIIFKRPKNISWRDDYADNCHSILLKTFEILASGSLLLVPLHEKKYYEQIGLFDNKNCMLVDIISDKTIDDKIEYITNLSNSRIIDSIRRNGKNFCEDNFNSKKSGRINI